MRLFLVSDVNFPLNRIRPPLLQPQTIGGPLLHCLLIAQASQGFALLKVIMEKIVLHIGQPPKCYSGGAWSITAA
jgi:hypothetical protein